MTSVASSADPSGADGAHSSNGGAGGVATFAKLHPREFHRQFLAHAVRPDGRSLNAARPTVIAAESLSGTPASSLVKIGNTAVLCAIKLEVGRPFDTKPQDGRLVVEVHLGPMCSPKFKVGRATEQAVTLSQWLTNAVINSGCLHLPDLSIVSGESSWVLYADVLCLSYDGNLSDAALLALMQALRCTKLPDTEVVEEGLGSGAQKSLTSEVCVSTTNFRNLPLHHTIVPVTLGVLEQQIVTDPNAAEEDLLSGQVTVVVNEQSALCQVHKAGGVPLTDAQLQECISRAKSRLPLLLPLFK